MPQEPYPRRGRTIDTATELAGARITVEIAAELFAVAVLNGEAWLADLSDGDLARLEDDIDALETTILRVLAKNSLHIALQTQHTGRLARHATQVRLRRPAAPGKQDMASTTGTGLLRRVAPRWDRGRRAAGGLS